jgi:hypothetical protein
MGQKFRVKNVAGIEEGGVTFSIPQQSASLPFKEQPEGNRQGTESERNSSRILLHGLCRVGLPHDKDLAGKRETIGMRPRNVNNANMANLAVYTF